MRDPDAFPFEVVADAHFPGWWVLICRRWRPPVPVGFYRANDASDDARLAADLRKLRALWRVPVAKREKTRAAIAALQGHMQ